MSDESERENPHPEEIFDEIAENAGRVRDWTTDSDTGRWAAELAADMAKIAREVEDNDG